MSNLILAAFWTDFAAGFGATAAVLAVGGFILLRIQRNRQEYTLLRAAIDKGLTEFPGTDAPWRLAMRQGLMTVTLGIGLLVTGAGALALGRSQSDLSSLPTSQPADTLLSAPKPRDDRGRLTSEGRLYSAARERIQHGRRLETAGFMLTAAGTILVLLGGVRMLLARAEKRRMTDDAVHG